MAYHKLRWVYSRKKKPKSWVLTVGICGVLAWNCFQPLTQHHQLHRSTRVRASCENQQFYCLRGTLTSTKSKKKKKKCSQELPKRVVLPSAAHILKKKKKKQSSHLDVNRMGKTKITADLSQSSQIALAKTADQLEI